MKNVFLILAFIALSAVATVAQSSPTVTASPSGYAKTDVPPTKSGFVVPPEKAQPVRMPRFDKPPVIDGKLSYLFRKSFG